MNRFEGDNGIRSIQVSIPGAHEIKLLLHLPQGYPSTDAPVAEVCESFGLTTAQRDAIVDDLHAVFERSNGQVCLYEWIDGIRETYGAADAAWSTSEAEEPPTDDVDALSDAQTLLSLEPTLNSDAQTLRPRVDNAHAVRDPAREAALAPLIFHGGIITDRKSTFQVGRRVILGGLRPS